MHLVRCVNCRNEDTHWRLCEKYSARCRNECHQLLILWPFLDLTNVLSSSLRTFKRIHHVSLYGSFSGMMPSQGNLFLFQDNKQGSDESRAILIVDGMVKYQLFGTVRLHERRFVSMLGEQSTVKWKSTRSPGKKFTWLSSFTLSVFLLNAANPVRSSCR